jgi:hypothetical protein
VVRTASINPACRVVWMSVEAGHNLVAGALVSFRNDGVARHFGSDIVELAIAEIHHRHPRRPDLSLDKAFGLGSGGAQRPLLVTPITATAVRTWYF